MLHRSLIIDLRHATREAPKNERRDTIIRAFTIPQTVRENNVA